MSTTKDDSGVMLRCRVCGNGVWVESPTNGDPFCESHRELEEIIAQSDALRSILFDRFTDLKEARYDPLQEDGDPKNRTPTEELLRMREFAVASIAQSAALMAASLARIADAIERR